MVSDGLNWVRVFRYGLEMDESLHMGGKWVGVAENECKWIKN